MKKGNPNLIKPGFRNLNIPMQGMINPNMMNQNPMFMQNSQIPMPIQMGPNMGGHYNQPGSMPPPNFPMMKTVPPPKII